MKRLTLNLFFGLISFAMFSQTVNYALQNGGNGYVKSSAINQLNGTTEATIQLWFNPQIAPTAGMQLFAQDNFSIEFADHQTIKIKSGGQEAVFVSSFQPNTWYQLTITVKNGAVQAFINNRSELVSGALPTVLPTSAIDECYLIKNFNGKIDEIRVWKRALEQKDFFWRNTLNKFNPNYDALISYWKGDQEQCEHLVDYKFAHHGVFTNVQRTPVTDNEQFQYRVVTGYTNLMRFIDRPNINRDMFLMTNDLILLSAKVQQDGSLFPEYADNSATPTHVTYTSEYHGRTGVMSFAGAGAKMVSADGNAPFDPTDKFGRGEPIQASIGAWIYIDSWVEGAEIFSKYKDEANCMVVKLGTDADKSLVVNLNGMTATLKGKLQQEKWHYIGVYLAPTPGEPSNIFVNPINISIDFTNYDRFNGVELSGSALTISKVPTLSTTPIVIGNNFNGKMDEIMVWGSNRKNSAKNDAENGYKLNVGNWDNIFLNAYWKGDDAENIGKDSQSFTGMIDFIRHYYANHRGMKIRLGIIYPDGDRWHSILNVPANVNRLIADAQKLLPLCDGFDIDLEWCYSQWQYDILNNVIKRFANEVMAAHRDTKTYSVSLHQVSYAIDRTLISDIDYFTFQLYGPQSVTYSWNWYENAYNQFQTYGFPKNKTLLSYGVLLVNNGEEGYKDLFEKYGMNDSNYDPALNQWNCDGTIKYFNGVNQTKRKQDFIIDNGLQGTMYFDMGNDQRMDDYKSLIRAQNDIIAANVDTLITHVDINGTSLFVPQKNESKLFEFYPNPVKNKLIITLFDDVQLPMVNCQMLALDGKLIKEKRLTATSNEISLEAIARGTYLLRVTAGTQTQTRKLVVQ